MAEKNKQDNVLEIFFGKTRIKDIMKSPVVTVNESGEVSEALLKFKHHHVSHLCVIDRSGQLVGILSPKYLYKAQSPRKILSSDMPYDPDVIIDGDAFYSKRTLDSYILRSIMQDSPFTLKADQPVAEAVKFLAKKNLGCIPIVDNNKKPIGVITAQEIVKFTANILEQYLGKG